MAYEMIKVVIVEPNKPAYITEIEHSLKGMKEAVGGLIEPIYYLNDPNAVMVGNEEAKLIGMDGNPRKHDVCDVAPKGRHGFLFAFGRALREICAGILTVADDNAGRGSAGHRL